MSSGRATSVARPDRAQQGTLDEELGPVQLRHPPLRLDLTGLERAGVQELA
jgi:hypothetical protein